MIDTAGTPEEIAAPLPRPSMFWRVLRVLIIVYCYVLGTLMLFVGSNGGFRGFFAIDLLRQVEDITSFFEWLINPGNIATAVMAVSALAWAVAWKRGEGRPSRRLEWCYGIAAMVLFAALTAGFLSLAVYYQLQGWRNQAMSLLIACLIVVPMANAPALLMATYVLWGLIRRSMPAQRSHEAR